MSKKNYYAVKKGRVPGVYTTWAECQQQVKGFPNAIYKSFPTLEEAEAFIQGEEEDILRTPEGKHYDIYTGGSFIPSNQFTEPRYSWGFIVYEAGGIVCKYSDEGTDKESATKHQGITGEVEAVIKAVTWAEGQGVPITIHYSFTGIAHWLSGDWVSDNSLAQRYVESIKPHLEWVKFSKVSTQLDIERHEKAKKLTRRVLEKT